MRALAFALVVLFIMPAEAQTILPFRESTISSGNGGAGLTYPNDVFIQGDFAYVAGQVSHSLDIIDISVPSAPVFVSTMVSGGRVHLLGANAVFVSGNHAYVTALEEALEIIDVSDPANPVHVSSIANHMAGAQLTLPSTIFVENGFAYVGGCTPEGSAISYVGYFGIFDVSNPANPMPKGSLTTIVNIRSLVAVGNYVYAVQSTDNRLVVIDVTDKNDPKVVGTLTDGQGGALLSNPVDITVIDTKAYITSSGSNALEIVDITNPIAPLHLGKLAFSPAGSSIVYPYSLQVEGNYAYVTGPSSNSTGVIEVVDISNSAAPVRVGALTSGSGATFVRPVSIAVKGPIATVVGQQSNSMQVISLSNPTSPQQVGTILKGSAGASLGNVFDIEWADDILYIAANSGIQLIDVHDGVNPVPLAFLAEGAGGAKLATCTSIEISGSYAYATSAEDNALEILDISNPAQIHHVASIADGQGGSLLGAPRDVCVAGNYAYVAAWNNHAVEVIDISNPAAPVHAGSITDGDEGSMFARPMCIEISGNFAYVVGWEDNSVEILNISDPAHPHHAATISNAMSGVSLNGPGSIMIKDGYAFVADNGNSELEIFDVSNPTNPSHVAFLAFSSSIPAFSTSHAIARAGNYCLIADYNEGRLKFIDVSNPAAPVNIQLAVSISSPTTVAAVGNHAFVGNSGSVTVLALFAPPQVMVMEATEISSTSFQARWEPVSYTPIFQPVTYGIDVSQDNFATFLPGFQNKQVTGGNIGIQDLQPLTEYQYRVRATNVNGTGPVSGTMTVKTGPSAPVILPAQVTQTSITAHWGLVADVTNYLFTISRVVPPVTLEFLVFGDSIKLTGLPPGTSYSYKVKAGSSWGYSSPSSQVTVTTIPPNPETVAATKITPYSFQANWLSAVGATGYYLDVSKDGFNTFVIQDIIVPATTYLVESDLKPNAEYKYRVRAFNVSGISGYSNLTTVYTLVTGIGDISEVMKLSPNPTNGVLYYELPVTPLSDAVRLIITDVTGRQYRSEWSTSDQFIDVSGLPAGLYFFTADLGSHFLREKFIKK